MATSAVATTSFIAIINDEADVRRATSSLVRSLGFTAKSFVSAEEFLADEDNLSASCIVSDVNMAGMSGIDLYLRLQEEVSSRVPFVFITAFPESQVREHIGERVRVLQKPFHADALAACLDAALQSKGGGSY